jgi:menaquinone-dependent protoporphyrinogen IX oxidase
LSQNKTLIAYESKMGASKQAAEIIAETLRGKFGLDVDIVDLKEQPNPDVAQYRNIVVGAGVRGGRTYGKATKLLTTLCGKQVAFFNCSSWAGTPGSYENAKARLVEKTASKYPNINFVSCEAFGGRIKYFRRLMLDNRNPEKIKVWAEQLGEKFSQ